jgi:glycine cleavage system H protein
VRIPNDFTFIPHKGELFMLETMIDKFIFRVPEDLYFNDTGLWVALEGSRGRVGLSDFAQQLNGDVTFAHVAPVGTLVKASDELGNIETVKAILEMPSPVSGRIVEINPELELSSELINLDPYGKGWIAVLELSDWEEERKTLRNGPGYLEFVQRTAEAELNK